jgi:Domain of unknown function (DUF4249)
MITRTLEEFFQQQPELRQPDPIINRNMKYSGLIIILICFGCREYYEPPALKNNPGFLVVDGFLNSSPDSTHIKLTYTRNLADTAPAVPALNASLVVEGDQNTLIPLNEKGNAVYSNLLSLKTSEKYRLTITTSDGAGEILYKYP